MTDEAHSKKKDCCVDRQIADDDATVVRRVAMDVERSARLARWFGLGLIFVGVVAMLISSIVTVWIGLRVRDLLNVGVAQQEHIVEDRARQEREAKEESKLVGDILACILGQFSEHRHASRYYFENGARVHGFEPPDSPPPQPYNHERVIQSCESAQKTLGGVP